ncbi:MAG: threonine ammonia-lyase, partial [Ruminococcus sp.]
RSASLCIELMDKPGQLEQVSKIIAKCGGNVTSVHHERASEIADINGCYLRLVLETRNFEHIKMIEDSLKEQGFKLV